MARKEKAALAGAAQPTSNSTPARSYTDPEWRPTPSPDCAHPAIALYRTDCGAGGHQVRLYCTSCWRAGNAIPHGLLHAECVELLDRAELDARRAAC